jgi:hypothetical protein
MIRRDEARKTRFVRNVDFVTSPGYLREQYELGATAACRRAGMYRIVTDLGILRYTQRKNNVA